MINNIYSLYLFTVVKTTIFLQDINEFSDVNEVYKECKIQFIVLFI